MKTIVHALIFLLNRINDRDNLDWREQAYIDNLLETLREMENDLRSQKEGK